MESFNWQCPFCGNHSTITDQRFHSGGTGLTIPNADGLRYFHVRCVVCPNSQCRRFTAELIMYEYGLNAFKQFETGKMIRTWKLIPSARMKVMPEYVPRPIVKDYEEACSIVELSPKASATLSRRCLQGMIRDFWKISKPRLIDEVKELESKVDPVTWKAIDAVRKLGNIGAHMEQDINVIVDVDPDEAQQLIKLIELLIDDWYVSRHEREERLKAITGIAESKEAKRKSSTGADSGG